MIRGEGSQRQPNFGVYGARWDSSMSSFFPHSPTTTSCGGGGAFCFSPTSHLQTSPQHQQQSALAQFNPLLPPPTSTSPCGPGPIGSPTHTFGSSSGIFSSLSPTHSTSSSNFFHFSPPQKSSAASAVHTQPNASAGFNPFMMHRQKPKQDEGKRAALLDRHPKRTFQAQTIRFTFSFNAKTRQIARSCASRSQKVSSSSCSNRWYVWSTRARCSPSECLQDEAHDELKHKQLLELSLMNGTFKAVPQLQTPRKQWPPPSF